MKWILLADPKAYGWDDLVRDGRAVWDGITNRSAQNRLAETKVGELALIYHTAPDKALIGVARVHRGPYPDPAAEDRVVIDLQPVVALERRLPLDQIKGDKVLAGMGFVRMPRVAVHAVSDEQWDRVLELTDTDPGAAADLDPAEVGGP